VLKLKRIRQIVVFNGAALLATMGLAWSTIACAQDEPLMAEQQPLVAQSMLLDITRRSDGGLVAVGERGHVVLSATGSEWDQAETVPTRATLTTVTSAGNTLWAAGHDTTILRSEDGGRNWELLYEDPDRQQPVMDIHFLDESNGFAIGAYGLMMRTRDGGLSWEEQVVSEDEWHLNGLVDLGGGRFIIAGEAGYSYFSRDGGKSWSIVEMPYPGSMFGALAIGPCVLAYGLRGNMQQSCDQGETWLELESPTESSLAGGAYHDGLTVVVGNSGQVLLLRENGEIEYLRHPSGVDFAAALPLEGDDWVLVGNEGIHRLDLAAVPETAGAGGG